MEHKSRILSPDLLMEPLIKLLEEVDAVPLTISGGSMTPFLVHGRDTVYLSKIDKALKKGDMVLYQRDNGRYVLHRVMRTEGGLYTMIGDAQIQPEPCVRQDQLLAVVTAVQRKGRLLKRGDFWWVFFEKIWIRLVPVRPFLRNTYSFFKRLFCRGEFI